MQIDRIRHANEQKWYVRVFFWFLNFLIGFLMAFGSLIVYLSITEYRPEDSVMLEVDRAVGESGEEVLPGPKGLHPVRGQAYSLLSWNVGYGALGDNADFFMDGGNHVMTADEERLRENMESILDFAVKEDADFTLFQEMDVESRRSHRIDETQLAMEAIRPYSASFAYNFKVDYLPFPLPPIGKVESGLFSLTDFEVREAERIQLPIPFRWPVRMANLKRCLLVQRIPVEGAGGAELVMINLHLEAYDSGEGKVQQTRALRELLHAEAAKGNYVIAAGDFNQIFDNIENPFPLRKDVWQPGVLETAALGSDYTAYADADTPSCRSLDRPLAGADPEDFQYYIIDGAVVSGNIRVESMEVVDLGFKASDHNPVRLRFVLE